MNLKQQFKKETGLDAYILNDLREHIAIYTVSEMAIKLNKTPKETIYSKNYRKIKIGKQTFVVNGLKDNNIPF